MSVPLSTFLNFAAKHAVLLKNLSEVADAEYQEIELGALIQRHLEADGEHPEGVIRKLKEFRIVIPLEAGGAVYQLAPAVGELFRYLLDEATATTPEMVKGFIDSLGKSGRQAEIGVRERDPELVKMAVREIDSTLRRIHRNVQETRARILLEVMSYKSSQTVITAQSKYRQILYWLQRYVEPMLDLIKVEGLMDTTFLAAERILKDVDRAVLPLTLDVERTIGWMKFVRHYSLRVFEHCLTELTPLYEQLRRSTAIAAGASWALERLHRDGPANWEKECLVSVFSLRFQGIFNDRTIKSSLEKVYSYTPTIPPVIDFTEADEPDEKAARREWLDSLDLQIEPHLPTNDLLALLTQQFPGKSASNIVAAFTSLVFDKRFESTFTETGPNRYASPDFVLVANSVSLRQIEK